MLTLEQYRDPKLAQIHHDYLAGGPLGIWRPSSESWQILMREAMQLALEFYGPMYLLYSVYDGAEEKNRFRPCWRHILIALLPKVEAGYRAEASGIAVLSRRNNG